MKRNIADYVWFTVSVVSFALLSVSFLLMSSDNGDTENGLPAIALTAGVMFWASLVIGISAFVILSRRRKNWFAVNKIRKSRFSHKAGAFSFFKNLYGAVADVIAAISVIGLVISVIMTDATGFACYVFVSLLVFSFSMHCIFNGNIYNYIFNRETILKTVEKERANTSKKERVEKK